MRGRLTRKGTSKGHISVTKRKRTANRSDFRVCGVVSAAHFNLGQRLAHKAVLLERLRVNRFLARNLIQGSGVKR